MKKPTIKSPNNKRKFKGRMKPLNLDVTILKYGNEIKREWPHVRFIQRLEEAEMLFIESHKLYKKRIDEHKQDTTASGILEMIKENYLTTLISELEIFCKNLVTVCHWTNEDGFDSLLDTPISLNKAFKTFGASIKREHIIATHYYFMSLGEINHVFSLLSGTKDFLKNVELNEIFNGQSDKVLSLRDVLKEHNINNWRQHLKDAFEWRHKITHEGISKELDYTFVRQLGYILYHLTMGMTYYCFANHINLELNSYDDDNSNGAPVKRH